MAGRYNMRCKRSALASSLQTRECGMPCGTSGTTGADSRQTGVLLHRLSRSTVEAAYKMKFTIFAQMKLLCTILALLVLILSVQPVCVAASAEDTCCTNNDCTEEQDNSNDKQDNGCASGCNPFQLCGCCAFCIVIPPVISFLPVSSITTPGIQWGILSGGITEEPVSGFWQPPRSA